MLLVLQFKLGASEYITCVTGHLGNTNDCFMVKSLKFDTNLRSYGPYGEEQGIPFELQGINGQIIGFHGRSSAKGLCALGAYIKVCRIIVVDIKLRFFYLSSLKKKR